MLTMQKYIIEMFDAYTSMKIKWTESKLHRRVWNLQVSRYSAFRSTPVAIEASPTLVWRRWQLSVGEVEIVLALLYAASSPLDLPSLPSTYLLFSFDHVEFQELPESSFEEVPWLHKPFEKSQRAN